MTPKTVKTQNPDKAKKAAAPKAAVKTAATKADPKAAKKGNPKPVTRRFPWPDETKIQLTKALPNTDEKLAEAIGVRVGTSRFFGIKHVLTSKTVGQARDLDLAKTPAKGKGKIDRWFFDWAVTNGWFKLPDVAAK